MIWSTLSGGKPPSVPVTVVTGQGAYGLALAVPDVVGMRDLAAGENPHGHAGRTVAWLVRDARARYAGRHFWHDPPSTILMLAESARTVANAMSDAGGFRLRGDSVAGVLFYARPWDLAQARRDLLGVLANQP